MLPQKIIESNCTRAGVDPDFNKTIAATDYSKEDDWAVYSAGQPIDKTLYNIRRERRCEFIADGMRMWDLKRWRALDQVKNYVIEGFNLWGGGAAELYKDDKGESRLITTGDQANVSNQTASGNNLCPYRMTEKTIRCIMDIHGHRLVTCTQSYSAISCFHPLMVM